MTVTVPPPPPPPRPRLYFIKRRVLLTSVFKASPHLKAGKLRSGVCPGTCCENAPSHSCLRCILRLRRCTAGGWGRGRTMRLRQAPEPRRLRPPVRCGSFTGEGRVEGKGSVSPPHSLLLKTAGTTQGRTCQSLREDLRAFWVEIRAPEVTSCQCVSLGL